MAYESPADRQQRENAERASSWGTMTGEQLRCRIARLDGHPMREPFGRILAGAVKRHAPHLAALLPPEWLDDPPRSAA